MNPTKPWAAPPENFTYHCAMQGCEGMLISAVGKDEPGTDILSKLESRGISTNHVQRNDDPSGRVTV